LATPAGGNDDLGVTGASGSLFIRPEPPADHDFIRQVVAAAFESDAEADLVELIRASPEHRPETALVAACEGEIVGHVMISDAVICNGQGEDRIRMLSPLAVLPDRQGEGFGSSLVRKAFDAVRSLAAS
jgi:putative acetyltransferase